MNQTGTPQTSRSAATPGQPGPRRRPRAATTPLFAVAETRHAAGSAMPRHRHDAAYVCIVLAGAFREESGRGPAHDASTGTLVIHPPGDVHSDTFGDRATRCLNVTPTPLWLDACARGCLFDTYRCLRADAALDSGRWLAAHLHAGDTAAELDLEAAAARLFAGIARDGLRRTRPARWIDRVCDEIRARPGDAWTLGGIAASIDVHPLHVARTFRQAVGTSLGAFVRARRLDRAQAELADSAATVAGIAQSAGFYDQSHFARAFRRQFGMSPGAWRAAVRSGEAS